jgi:hypothetical protein
MSLDNKPLEFIQESDLQELVDNKVREWKTIEYKETLPGTSDSQRTEFLADVSSFANASGGHLIYGIKGRDGMPVDPIQGLPISDIDATILRLESMIRDGIRPRISGIASKDIPLANGAVVIILRIPRSWSLPHQVTFQQHFRFYSRGSNGKYRLDVDELRSVFLRSEATAERVRNFRIERLGNIIAGETSVKVHDGAKVVLHLVPLESFDLAKRFNIDLDLGKLSPIYGVISGHRHNFDGYLTYDWDKGVANSYLQIFRNGIIEAVCASLLRNRGEERYIAGITYEEELLKAISRFLSIQQQLGAEPPMLIMLSFLGVKGYIMATRRALAWDTALPIDRDTLLIPEIMIEDFGVDPTDTMRPLFDAVWNACGWPRSMNYNDEGMWAPQY